MASATSDALVKERCLEHKCLRHDKSICVIPPLAIAIQCIFENCKHGLRYMNLLERSVKNILVVKRMQNKTVKFALESPEWQGIIVIGQGLALRDQL